MEEAKMAGGEKENEEEVVISEEDVSKLAGDQRAVVQYQNEGEDSSRVFILDLTNLAERQVRENLSDDMMRGIKEGIHGMVQAVFRHYNVYPRATPVEAFEEADHKEAREAREYLNKLLEDGDITILNSKDDGK